MEVEHSMPVREWTQAKRDIVDGLYRKNMTS